MNAKAFAVAGSADRIKSRTLLADVILYILKFMDRNGLAQNHTIEVDEKPLRANNTYCLSPYTSEQIDLLESVSSIVDHNFDYNTDSLKRIFCSLAILQCRSLQHWKAPWITADMSSCLCFTVLPSTELNSIQSLSAQRYNICTSFSLTVEVLETVKKEFLVSSVACNLRVLFEIIDIEEVLFPEIAGFRLENSRTKEVLQMKRITMEEAKENFELVLYEYAYLDGSSITDGVNGQAFILKKSNA